MYISKCRLRNGDNFLSDSMCSGICDQDRCGGREPTMTSSYAYCFTYHLNPLVHVRLPGTTNIEILWFHNVVRPKKLLHEQSNCRTLRGHHCHLVVSLLTWSSIITASTLYGFEFNSNWVESISAVGWELLYFSCPSCYREAGSPTYTPHNVVITICECMQYTVIACDDPVLSLCTTGQPKGYTSGTKNVISAHHNSRRIYAGLCDAIHWSPVLIHLTE